MRGRKRKERIDESKNVQTTPTRTYWKRSRPYQWRNVWFGIAVNDYDALFLFAISWFGRVYIAMENWRNLTETFLEEMIMNR